MGIYPGIEKDSTNGTYLMPIDTFLTKFGHAGAIPFGNQAGTATSTSKRRHSAGTK